MLPCTSQGGCAVALVCDAGKEAFGRTWQAGVPGGSGYLAGEGHGTGESGSSTLWCPAGQERIFLSVIIDRLEKLVIVNGTVYQERGQRTAIRSVRARTGEQYRNFAEDSYAEMGVPLRLHL